MKRFPEVLIASALLPTLALTSCESPPGPGRGAKMGAIVGGGIGAIAGRDLESAVVGGAIGAATGALVGAIVRDSQRYRYYDEYGEIPYASRTGDPGFVESPYYPYNIIDVRGIPRGATVLDPSTNNIFINP